VNKIAIALMTMVLAVAAAGCSRNPCRSLAKRVCETDKKSEACAAASRLTAADECADYLKNIDKFIQIKNTVAETEVRNPPAPPAPEAPAPVATEGAAVPAEGTPPAEGTAAPVEGTAAPAEGTAAPSAGPGQG